MSLDRRSFLRLGAAGAFAAGLPSCRARDDGSPAAAVRPAATAPSTPTPADYTIRIGPGSSSSRRTGSSRRRSTTGSFPGRCVRLKEGGPSRSTSTTTPTRRSNCTGTDRPCPSTSTAPPRKGRRSFRRTDIVASRSRRARPGLRFYHTHLLPGADLRAGQYGGQVGIVYIEPKHEPGAYDREVFLLLKEFEPSFSRGGDMPMDFLCAGDARSGARDRRRVGDEGVAREGDAARLRSGISRVLDQRPDARPRRADSREAARARAVSRRQRQRHRDSQPRAARPHVSGSSRSTAIPCRHRATCRCCGLAPANEFRRSSR